MSTVIQMPSHRRTDRVDSRSPVHCVGVTTRAATSSPSSLRIAIPIPSMPISIVDPPVACKRTVVWYIKGRGYYCHSCYESTFALDWRKIPIEDVIRLSDDETQFFKG